jgi:quinol monooxygenase YgiN
MIVVNAVVKMSKEDIQALHNAISAMEVASRAEAGCDDYTFSVELNDPNTLRITEKWHTVEALQEHFATAHMAEFQQVMGTYPPVSMDVKIFETQEIQLF